MLGEDDESHSPLVYKDGKKAGQWSEVEEEEAASKGTGPGVFISTNLTWTLALSHLKSVCP